MAGRAADTGKCKGSGGKLIIEGILAEAERYLKRGKHGYKSDLLLFR